WKNNLWTAKQFFNNDPRALAAFGNDHVDGYSRGPLMVGAWWQQGLPDADNTTFQWSGSDNTNHFFTTQDLLDRSKMIFGLQPPPLPPPVGPLTISERLKYAGT